ncbi:alpha-ketoglutarate-dependent dioxygenase AlkB family protein [Pontibacter akesuensis]|uniref:DNA-N1-methyladenine dioxygenase n=1 Tax=Pontibacter akesuensis TaxID=388950 RepID=A0A1I7HTV6_9BACT|nr:alpha-ketoglutarate-dependent dioxygenase AlkB [Pontibacter akesuensis]GHA63528.1 alkylated DNA repair protein [Pontibacter akesuensis]SFU64100.1 DNA-N1-methyladenine dioxygenase [Pontibacter akesuensis]
MNDTGRKLKPVPLPDAEVYFSAHFFNPEQSDVYLQELLQQVNWQQESIKLFGKLQPMPRLTAWYGDKGYTYSGLENKPQPWLPVLQELREQVEQASRQQYNSVLLNLYRTGQDSMGWHADNERELGQEPSIASLSFGGERRFALKHRSRKDVDALRITLNHGSLLLMQGPTQHHWLHHIPKTSKPVQPRINLTFRYVHG